MLQRFACNGTYKVHKFFQCGRIEVDCNDCDVTVEKLLQGNSRITVTGEGVCTDIGRFLNSHYLRPNIKPNIKQ